MQKRSCLSRVLLSLRNYSEDRLVEESGPTPLFLAANILVSYREYCPISRLVDCLIANYHKYWNLWFKLFPSHKSQWLQTERASF